MMNQRGDGWWPVLWDSGALAMGVLGPTRTYVQANAALCRLLEADAATVTAWSYERVGHPLDLDAELDAFVRLAEGAASVVYQRRFRTARGGEFSAEVRLCAGADDHVLQLVLLGAAAPTGAAPALDQRLAQLASALSHDALEPVRQAGVQAGLLAELQGGNLDERARKSLAIIERSTLKAGRQLRALALFARLGTPQLDPAPVRLRPLIDAAWNEQPAIPADAIHTIAAADDPCWRCDPRQVTSAVGALLANAIAFRDPARPLTVHVEVSTGEECTIRVSDNGSGIPAIDQGRLFRVFAAIGPQAGVGLGLATVQAVAAGHGGGARLVSEPGRGTQVSFTLAR